MYKASLTLARIWNWRDAYATSKKPDTGTTYGLCRANKGTTRDSERVDARQVK